MTVKHEIDVQFAFCDKEVPSAEKIVAWACYVLDHEHVEASECCIRIVDIAEISALNTRYRRKAGPTNVLSFPAQLPASVPTALKMLGDIAICAPIVKKEAICQHKKCEAHWAHMVAHGLLHLLDYNHIREDEAQRMESLEEEMLTAMGYDAPYA
jgi:probable rRNA maturation factor